MAGEPAVRVAVIGAGWAGLSAAVELASRGISVTVFEASRHLGGRARRVVLDNADLDNGQHILIGAYAATLAMIARVGVDVDAALSRLPLELSYADGFRLRAPRLPAPLNLLAGFLTARGLTLSESIAAARLMQSLKATRFRVQPDRSVAQLLAEHRQGERARRYLWEPLCVSALNTPAERASAQVFANVLRDGLTGSREASDLLIPRLDLSRLFAEPAATYVSAHGGEVLTGTPARALIAETGKYRVNEHRWLFDNVILATAPQHAGTLLGDNALHRPLRAQLDAFAYEPICTCYLGYPASTRLPRPMLGFQGGLLQWLFDRGQLGGPDGLFAAVISASGEHEQLSNDLLASRVHQEISAAMPGLSAPTNFRVITERRATFACTPGLSRPGTRTALPGLLLAGDYVGGGDVLSDYPGTLEAAVRSGLAAAAAI
jgi:squalene-associated FAD-dependent desaturase